MKKLLLIFINLIILTSKVIAHDQESFLIPPDYIIFKSPILSIGILTSIAMLMVILLKYVINMRLPKISLSNDSLKNLLAVFLFLGTSAWYWDGWWHIALGIDRFFSPPHVLVYIAHSTLIFSTLYLYQRTKEKTYYYFLTALAITYFFGFVDIFWHGYFGLEKEVTPLMVWSPSHLVSFSSTLIGALILLSFWIKDYNKELNKNSLLRLMLVSGAAFGILNIITLSPLHPLGWHHIFGTWGIIFTTLTSMFFLIYVGYKLPNTGVVTFSALAIYAFISFEAFTTASGIILSPHPTPPFWVHFLSIILGVIWIDFIDLRKKSLPLVGGLAGLITGVIYAGFWKFIHNNTFSYTFNESIIHVIMSIVGGTLGGVIIDIIIREKYKRLFLYIWSMNKKMLVILLVIIVFLFGFGYVYMFNYYNDQQNKISISEFQKHDPYGLSDNSIKDPDYEVFNVNTYTPSINLIIHEDLKSGWNLELQTTNFKFSPSEMEKKHISGEGYALLYIDSIRITKLYGEWYHIPELTEGRHEIKVILNMNNHKNYAINNIVISDSETIIVEEN